MAKVLWAGVLTLAASTVILVWLLLNKPQAFVSAGDAAIQSQLVGTWAGDHGVVMELRADGTARSRSEATGAAVRYFEWTASQHELQVFPDSRNRRVRGMINRYVAGGAQTRFRIVELTAGQLHLLVMETDKVVRFSKTEDALLEKSP